MGLFKWLRGGGTGPRDVLKNEPVPGRATGGGAPSSDATPSDRHAEIEDLVRRRRKIEAIKVLREATGCGLAEAKRAIENGTWADMV